MTDSNGSRKLLQTLLISTRLGRNGDVEEPEGVKPSFSYNVVIESIQRRENYNFAFVALKIEKQIAEKNLVDFTTVYMTGYHGDLVAHEEEEFAFFENLIEVAVWPRFRDLCQITASQAELDFPTLPLRPDTIARPKPQAEE